MLGLGVVLIAVATLAGWALADRHSDRRELVLGAAAGVLLVIAGLHLLPDAWSDAEESGLPVSVVPLTAAAGFALAGWLTRRGCACARDSEPANGAAVTVALAAHRVLEGAALALIGSATVVVALATHAFAEGLAAGSLLASASRRRTRWGLAALCLGPVAGVGVAQIAVPEQLEPLLVAAAAGVLLQAARIGLAAAFSSRPASVVGPAAALVGAGLVTALAVYGVG